MSKTIISSSHGLNAQGGHIITPESVLTYVKAGETTQHQTLAVDTVSMLINSIFEHNLVNVTMPVKSLIDHIPMAPALIRHWLRSNDRALGGLAYPAVILDMESYIPRLNIEKHNPLLAISNDTIKVDITLYVFARQTIDESPDLQPFDPAVWNLEAYELWKRIHAKFARIYEQECNRKKGYFPKGGAKLFRRMMHTHYEDFGMIFSKFWFDFGLGNMIQEHGYFFMRNMLLKMCLKYITKPMPLPPLCNAVTVHPGQRICAKCLMYKLCEGS